MHFVWIQADTLVQHILVKILRPPLNSAVTYFTVFGAYCVTTLWSLFISAAQVL